MTSSVWSPRLTAVWSRIPTATRRDGQSRSAASSPPSGQLAEAPWSTRDRATATALSSGDLRASSAGAGSTSILARSHQYACHVPSSQWRFARMDARAFAMLARRCACLHAAHASAQSSP